MTVLAFTRASLTRLVRDRVAMFFVVVLPVLVILLIGLTVRNFDRFRVAVVVQDQGPLATQLASDLADSPALQVRRPGDQSSAEVALRRGEAAAVVVIPKGFDATLRSGGTATVRVLATQRDSSSLAVQSAINAVVSRQAAQVQAATFAAKHAGADVTAAQTLAAQLQRTAHAITVNTRLVDSKSNLLPTGFSYSAPTMLVLFVFINALAGGAAVIQARTLGIYDRALSAPIGARTIIAGETLASLCLALLQSVLIVGIGGIFFGVSWGNPLAAVVLVFLWALVGTGAGMLSGSLFRTPEQASAIGPAIGIGFGMLGGCMWPLEIVPPAMRTVGHFTPQAWAVDAWSVLLSRGGGLADIAGRLAILAAFAAVFLVIASMRLRHRIVVR